MLLDQWHQLRDIFALHDGFGEFVKQLIDIVARVFYFLGSRYAANHRFELVDWNLHFCFAFYP
jgi:hypothetical protein